MALELFIYGGLVTLGACLWRWVEIYAENKSIPYKADIERLVDALSKAYDELAELRKLNEESRYSVEQRKESDPGEKVVNRTDCAA